MTKFKYTVAACMASILTVGAVTAQAQTSKMRPMAAQMETMEAPVVLMLSQGDFKDAKQQEIAAMEKALSPKIRAAAERQGVKVSEREVSEASQKIAMVMANGDFIELGDAIATKIDVEINIKFRPLKISIKLKF